MKKQVVLIAMSLLVIVLAVFVVSAWKDRATVNKIGIFMPSRNEARWQQDSDSLARQLQAKGYQVEIRNAGDDVGEQVRQIDAMINDGFKILVIAAIDSTKLTDILKKAADNKISVIAYDRLLMDTPHVDYYVTFDNFEVGRLQGAHLETALDLQNSPGPFNLEIFAGSPTDNNAVFFYEGAMSVLQQYIDSGKLIVRSGQTARLETAIKDWLPSGAQERMTELLNSYYSDSEVLHAVLSPNDGLAGGIIKALKESGYTNDGRPFPLLTGQDSQRENIRAILNGEQAMTVFKDTRTLADRTFRMIDDILLKKTPETNDFSTYNNNIKVVHTYMCKPVLVTKDNYKSILIDSGYYDMSDFQ